MTPRWYHRLLCWLLGHDEKVYDPDLGIRPRHLIPVPALRLLRVVYDPFNPLTPPTYVMILKGVYCARCLRAFDKPSGAWL